MKLPKRENKPLNTKHAILYMIVFYFFVFLFAYFLYSRNERYRKVREQEISRAHRLGVAFQASTQCISNNRLSSPKGKRPNSLLKVKTLFAKQKLVTIRGSYSSGTNWARQLLNKNCPKLFFSSEQCADPSIDADGVYGWKHGYLFQKDLEEFNKINSHYMLIITRDFLTWLVSSHKMKAFFPEEVDTQNKLQPVNVPFEKFIYLKINESIPDIPYFNEYYSNEKESYRILAPNIYQARKLLYSNWLENSNQKVYFVRYEDLLENPKKILEIAKVFGHDCLEDESLFNPVTHRVKMGKIDKNLIPSKYHPRYEFCVKMNKNEKLYLEMISIIDFEFENKQMNYTYPNTLQEYCQEVYDAISSTKENVESEISTENVKKPPFGNSFQDVILLSILGVISVGLTIFYFIYTEKREKNRKE